jgi:hypothetical protein
MKTLIATLAFVTQRKIMRRDQKFAVSVTFASFRPNLTHLIPILTIKLGAAPS